MAVIASTNSRQQVKTVPVLLFAFFAALMIGFRFHVGGDWNNYLRQFHILHYYSFEDALKIGHDAGYTTLSWIMNQIGWGIYGVNLVCGAIFMAGVTAFSLRLPNPWIGMVVAVPYLLVVVAMGYTRQAVALGFEFLALNALARKENWRFYAFIICGALFHKTAVVLILLGVFSGPNRFSLVRVSVGLVVAYLAMNAFMADYYDNLILNYVDAQMQSSGAMIRVMMNVLPAAIFFIIYRKWSSLAVSSEHGHANTGRGKPSSSAITLDAHWIPLAWACLACLPMLAIASTAVDRMALYLAPLQLYVWAHLPLVMNKSNLGMMIVFYHAAVLFVWLTFGAHAKYWLPYQSAIFQ